MGRRFDPDRAHMYSVLRGVGVQRLAKFSSGLLLVFTFGIPIVMDPVGTFSATNVPKLSLIVIGACLFFVFSIPSLAKLAGANLWRKITFLVVFALSWSIISLIKNSEQWDERLFGVYGRNLGFIVFISVFLIFWCSLVFPPKWIPAFFVAFSISSILVAVYFLLQYVGIDFGVWEQNYGKTPSATLGNPNYVVSLIAVGLSLPLSFLILQPSKKIKSKVLMLLILIAGTSCMSLAESFQGFLILGVSLTMLYLFKYKSILLEKGTILRKRAALFFIGTVLISLFSTFIFQKLFRENLGLDSVFARFDYWRASINMIRNSPFFGLGFDSFGDYYLEFRGRSAATRSPGLFSDSPHNFFLELAIFAGLPLAICYVLIQIQVLRAAVSALKVLNQRESFYLITLITYWTGFHIQSLINPSSLALLPLQFVTSGLIFSFSQNVNQEIFHGRKPPILRKRAGRDSLSFIGILSTLFVGLLLIPLSMKYGLATWEKDRNFKAAATKGDGSAMISISNDWPFVFSVSELTARTLLENGYEALGIEVVRNLIEKNPRNIRGWRLLYERSAETQERALAIAKMKALDPFNTEYDQMKP